MVLVFLALAFMLAFLVESFVEILFGTPMDKITLLKPYKWLLMYAAILVGVAVCFYYKLDLIALMIQFMCEQLKIDPLPLSNPTSVGTLFTGLAIGKGSNYLHQFVSKFFPPKVG